MCSRFSFVASSEKMRRQFNLNVKQELQKSYNIGASQNAYILTNKSLELQIFRWGLIPYWANDEKVGLNLINASADGIGSKLSFRLPVRQRRCIVFADSYYDWKQVGREKQAYRITMNNGYLMAFAGVWDVWVSEDDRVYKTFSIITTQANREICNLNTQMPVILPTGALQARWLEEASLKTALSMLKPLPEGMLKYYPVSNEVGDLDNNYPSLHDAIQLEEES